MENMIPLGELFTIKSGDYHAVYELAPGNVPLVSCGEINHGLVGYFDIPPEKRYADVITVAYNGQPLTAEYRPYEFGAKDDIGILQPYRETDALSLVYVAAVLNALRWRYSYGRKCFKGKLQHLLVGVPITRMAGTASLDGESIRKILGCQEPQGRMATIVRAQLETGLVR